MSATYAQTTEQADATEARDAAYADAILAGERWARRPDTIGAFILMTMAHDDHEGSSWWADRELARLADAAESRAVLAAVLAPRADG